MSKRRAAIIDAMAAVLVEHGWPDERRLAHPELFLLTDGSIDLGQMADAVLAALKRPASRGGSPQAAGGRARAESLTPEQRSDIAKKAAAARWNTHSPKAPEAV